MRKKIALMIARWLMRYVPDYVLIRTEDRDRVGERLNSALKLANLLNDENDRLRRWMKNQQAAYDALLEEMEELLHG